MIRETLRDDHQIRFRDKKYILISERVCCGYPWMLVHWICLCFSLFLCTRTSTLVIVDSSSFKIEEFFHKMEISCWELKIWIEESFFPCNMTWFALQLWSFVQNSWIFCLLICTLLPLCHSPRHDSWRHSVLMLVFSHSDTLYLSGVYDRMRVPQNRDSLFYHCPVLHHFPSDFYFCRWGWEWVHICSLESMLRTTIVSDGFLSIHHQAS